MFGRRILLIIPHPDDEVVGCCAAIGRAVALKARVFGFYLTTGIPPRRLLWWWQRPAYPKLVARRLRESQKVARLLGIEVCHQQEIPSRTLKSQLAPSRRRLEEAIQRLGIDLLWAPAYEGAHQDHDAASFLASTLKEQVEVWEFSEYHYFGGRVHSQQFFVSDGSEQLISLTPLERERKRQALSIYKSEQGNLRHIGTVQEVFRPQKEYNYAEPPHPGRLFYQRFQWVKRHPRVDFCQPREVCAAIMEFAGFSGRN